MMSVLAQAPIQKVSSVGACVAKEGVEGLDPP